MTRTARAGPGLETESFLLGLSEHDLVLGMGPEGSQVGENPQALEKQTIMPTESGPHAGLVTLAADRQTNGQTRLTFAPWCFPCQDYCRLPRCDD